MTQQEFDKILARYFSGEATAEERLIIERFYDRLQEIEDNHIMWTPGEKEKVRMRMLKSVVKLQNHSRAKTVRLHFLNWKIAASIVFFLLAAGLFAFFLFSNPTHVNYITKSTAKGQRATFTLSDGTTIKLNAESSISFPQVFSEESRSIKLSGEAFFKVSKDPHRPFIVETEGLTTTVLGTSFNISAFPGEQVAVTVATGKVRVAPSGVRENRTKPPSGKTAILVSNQQAVYNPEDRSLQVSQVDLGTYLAWENNTLTFQMMPFAKVVQILERWYDVDIKLENDLADDCLVRATYKNESLENVLRGLKLLVNFDYEFENNGEVKIVGKGCRN